MAEIIFELSIPSDLYLLNYQGAAQQVIAQSIDGRRVQFPALLLRPFVSHDGVHGTFVISFDDQHKCQGLRRLD